MHARVVRSGLVEAVHQGSIAVVAADGTPVLETGDVDRPFFLRSAAKPFQAATVLEHTEHTERLDAESVAVMCGSHDGLPVHIGMVERILASAGVCEDDLATPPAWPKSASSLRRLLAGGHTAPRPIWHNCSGKHAGMLMACVSQGWPTRGYIHPEHPLQVAIRDHMVDVFGEEALPAGVDGCGVPVFRTSTRAMAVAFSRLIGDRRYSPVVNAMSRFPVLASGPGNADAEIAVWLGGVAKRGAEGCLGIGLPDRGAIAVKIWDGADRGVAAGALAALDRAGWIPEGPRKNLESALARRVFGGGEPVGTVEAVLEMERP